MNITHCYTGETRKKKIEYRAQVHLFQQFYLKGETNIGSPFRYFKPLFITILLIVAYSL